MKKKIQSVTTKTHCQILSYLGFLSRAFSEFKTHLLGRSFRTLVKNVLFLSLIDVGSHNPPHWSPTSLLIHVRCLGLISFIIAQAHRQPILSSLGFPFRACSQGLKTCQLERGFHICTNNVLLFSHSTFNYLLWFMSIF